MYSLDHNANSFIGTATSDMDSAALAAKRACQNEVQCPIHAL